VGGYGLSFKQRMEVKQHAAKVHALAARATGGRSSGSFRALREHGLEKWRSRAVAVLCYALRYWPYETLIILHLSAPSACCA
jgi:hypothetical protein